MSSGAGEQVLVICTNPESGHYRAMFSKNAATDFGVGYSRDEAIVDLLTKTSRIEVVEA